MGQPGLQLPGQCDVYGIACGISFSLRPAGSPIAVHYLLIYPIKTSRFHTHFREPPSQAASNPFRLLNKKLVGTLDLQDCGRALKSLCVLAECVSNLTGNHRFPFVFYSPCFYSWGLGGQGLSMQPWLFWKSLCRPGIKDTWHYAWPPSVPYLRLSPFSPELTCLIVS